MRPSKISYLYDTRRKNSENSLKIHIFRRKKKIPLVMCENYCWLLIFNLKELRNECVTAVNNFNDQKQYRVK